VSTPVTWDELTTALRKKNAKLLTFGPDDVLKRVAKQGDLFGPVLKLKQKLPPLAVFSYP
jgi:bifunctional non-homologous end joining protein LigD